MRSSFLDNSYDNHEYMTTLNYHGPVARAKALGPHFVEVIFSTYIYHYKLELNWTLRDYKFDGRKTILWT